MSLKSSHYLWAATIIAVAAIAGSVVTAWTTSSVPHDLIGIASVITGYIVGVRAGQLAERIQANGHVSDKTPPP